MKKKITIISFLVLLPGLVACSSAAKASTASQTNGNLLSTVYENALSVPMQLAIGTFKLEGTENMVDAKTASDLLPLWKAVRSLSSSSTAAPQELSALFKQIQETMTPKQTAAISAMHLTRADITQVAQEMGLSLGGGGFGNFTPEQRATAQAARQSGQGSPGGGFPGGGFPGGGPGGGFNTQQRQTPIAGQAGTSQTTQGVNPLILDAIIKFLQAKVQ
jgi:hypothetical protein